MWETTNRIKFRRSQILFECEAGTTRWIDHLVCKMSAYLLLLVLNLDLEEINNLLGQMLTRL